MLADNIEIRISGRFCRIARIHAEFYERFDNPNRAIAELKLNGKADVLSFLQSVADRVPKDPFRMEMDLISVLPVTTYEKWWKSQIKDKTRNMIRKAAKNRVEIRVVDFSDELVRGIQSIYDETPVRQGKLFPHYRKDFETLKRAHITFLERSQFLGAYLQNELIGFIKLVHGDQVSNIMQILSKGAYRDMAPTNALIAKAVELCAQRGIANLHYGVWSQRGLGDFKRHHGFERIEIPRYFVPLTWRGHVGLCLSAHRKLSDRLPNEWVNKLAGLRARWLNLRSAT